MRPQFIVAIVCLGVAGTAAGAQGGTINFANPPGKLEFLLPSFGDEAPQVDRAETGSLAGTTGGGPSTEGPHLDFSIGATLSAGIVKRWTDSD